MKRFFPSNIMLIPFVVKHYEENDERLEQERDETEITVSEEHQKSEEL